MSATPTHKRDVELEDVFNLRDLGGYSTAPGEHVRWRLLFRGGGLQRLAGPDLEAARDLGWLTVIDLRTDAEVARSGTCATELLGARYHHLPMIREVWDPVDLDPRVNAEEYLFERYREMLDEGAPTIGMAITLLGSPGNLPGVFYCAAGKDRTGVLAAIILDLLAVDHETIAHDYHLSKERVDRIRARARARQEATTMVQQPETFMQAPAGAMRLLLHWMAERHGGSAGYLRSIGVRDASIMSLRAALLEPRAT
jgi:protein-tyrosine phosphatase